MDILWVLAAILFFVLSMGFVRLCDKLHGSE